MHDVKWIREHPEEFDAALQRRGLAPHARRIVELDAQRRALMTREQELQASAKLIGRLKAQDAYDEAAQALETMITKWKKEHPGLPFVLSYDIDPKQRSSEETRFHQLFSDLRWLQTQVREWKHTLNPDAELQGLLTGLPNVLADDVPDGPDESANVEVARHGEPPSFTFAPKEHDELGGTLGMDFETAAQLAGARFVVLRGQLARLSRALGQFMLDVHTREHGYTEVVPPLLVRDAAVYGTGQLPKFADDLFRTTDGRWLIPTSEVPLANLVAGRMLDEDELPLRFTALTPCFRSEAGAAGKDTRGMIRQHQFDKVELISVTTPERSDAEHERMTACAETILDRLGLAFRRVALCSGDTGFAARKTWDVEVWLPGQGRYREISSCSTCGDFQARRMNARYRPNGEKGTRFVHTLNGSGVAVGRALIAVLETYQRADGSVDVPAALAPYMGGSERLVPHAA